MTVPRWARLHEELAGDLEELYALRAQRDGKRTARRWWYRQVVRAIVETHFTRRGSAEARRKARKERDSMIQTFAQDVRYGIRMLRKQPAFTVTAVVMLALGVGANATVFSWINAVLLDPLPGAARSHELVQLSYTYRGAPLTSFSPPDFRDMRSLRAFSGVVARDDLAVGIVIDKEAERGWAEIVSANYFNVLGVPAWRGRPLQPADDEPGAPSVAVISYDYWVSRFAARDDVIGRSVIINAHPFTIVGVAQPGFRGGSTGLRFDLWVPLGSQPHVVPGGNRLEVRGGRWLSVLGRLNSGVSIEQARDELVASVANLNATYPGYNETSANVFRLAESPDGGASVLRPVLLVLMTVAVIVLLITCANLSGLLLARAAARQREMAIRLSVGAGRGRLMQQLLVEAALLALCGTLAAFLALRWTAGLLTGFAPPSELPIYIAVAVDTRVVGFTAILAFATLILSALVPALQATLADMTGTLRDCRSGARGATRHRLRHGLVAAQVALSTVLLVGAGLCIRSLVMAQKITPGFDPSGVIVGWLDLVPANYDTDQQRTFYTRVLERVRALPGVESVTLGRRIPLGFTGLGGSGVTIEGRQALSDDPRFVNISWVGPDYARTMKIPLVSGRDFSSDDITGQQRVAIVTEAMAKVYWPGANAVGRRFMFGQPRPGAENWITVVGVAKDIKQRRMTEVPSPVVWLPVMQNLQPSMILHARAAGLAGVLAGDLPRILRELDPNVTFYNVSLLSEHVKAATFQQRLAANLLVVFGGLALLLAAIGSYGVLAYLVGQRRREIGIRLAIGATRGSVFNLIVSSGAKVVALGAAFGLLLSVAAGFGLRGLLIGVAPTDPITYGAVTAVLMLVAFLACAIPAKRAATLDPALTLRDE
jgi:predicted permease